MTYGRWLERARHELTQARERLLPSQPAVTLDDAGVAVAARQRVYLRLARLVELVVGGQPARADINPETVDVALRLPGDHATRLYLGLTGAAGVPQGAGLVAPPICRAGRHLAAAGEALAVAGDILASHAPPGRDPLTPEGVAMRAGAGYAAALADIAGLTRHMLAVDAGLPGWLLASHRLAGDIHASAVGRAWWAATGSLAALVHQVEVAAGGAPGLLPLLQVAPASRGGVPITSGKVAGAVLLAARDWMHRHPGQLRAAHLAAATRAGLAVSVLAESGAPGADVRAWNLAAHAASRLHSDPPHGEAVEVVKDLVRLARWVRPQPVGPDRPGSGGRRAGTVEGLAAVLPSLAEVLRTAAGTSVRHGHFFVVDRRDLERHTRGLIYRAATRWRVAEVTDDDIYRLRMALFEAASTALAASPAALRGNAPRLAKLAFATAVEPRHSADAAVPPDPAGHDHQRVSGRKGGRSR